MGRALKRAGNLRAAASNYERAIELKPDYVEALANLSTVYNMMGRYDAGLALASRALTIDPDHVGARLNMALRYWETGRVSEAFYEFNQILKTNPLSPEAAFAEQIMMNINIQK